MIYEVLGFLGIVFGGGETGGPYCLIYLIPFQSLLYYSMMEVIL